MSMPGGSSGQSHGSGGMESMRSSASQITMYLKNIDFPADKQKIISMAKSNGAPEPVIQMLNRMPDKQYMASTDVESEFGKMK